MSSQADTKLLGFWPVFAFLLCGPFIAATYALFSFGYWLDRKGWTDGWRLIIVAPFLLLFAVANTLHNWTVCTVLFREFPRECFTTSRLKRHKSSPDAWRRELADMMGGFLNSQDGGHY
jgi:hypothetical protein